MRTGWLIKGLLREILTLLDCPQILKTRNPFLSPGGQNRNTSQSGLAPGAATVSGEANDVGIRGDVNETCAPALAVGHQSFDLNQFAAGFPSLYCSEISSTSLQLDSKSNEHKRQGSPTMLVVEDKASKKRHCTSYPDQLQSSNEVPVYAGKGSVVNSLGMAVAAEKPKTVLQSHVEVEVGSDISAASSIRCSKTRNSPSFKNECSTPGIMHINSHARETPKSTRGSSKFSPGEAFWDEAIQVADGLLGGDADREKFDCKCECATAEGKRCVQHNKAGMHDSLGFPGKQGHADGSPLPIKHFDFSLEEKKPKQLRLDDKEVSVKNGSVLLDCSSANNKALQSRSSTLAGRIEGGSAVAEAFSTHIAQRQKVDLRTPESDNFLSHSPHMGKVISNVVSDGLRLLSTE